MNLSDIDGVGWCGIALIVFFGVGIVLTRAFRKAKATVGDEAQITHDIELEPSALDKLDSMERATVTDQRHLIKMMMAAGELPSYITEEVADTGAAAAITLIERTSYERMKAAHAYAETGLVTTAV